jgi:hypothetical protein
MQEHAAQLILFLGQQVGAAPDWVTREESSLGPVDVSLVRMALCAHFVIGNGRKAPSGFAG